MSLESDLDCFKQKFPSNYIDCGNKMYDAFKNYTHYYHLNRGAWRETTLVDNESFAYWFICDVTCDVLLEANIRKDIYIIHNDICFVAVTNFTDEEITVMDILE